MKNQPNTEVIGGAPCPEPQNVANFRRLAKDIANTYAMKNADYNDSFGRSVEKYGMIAALTRISDKFNRIENLMLKHGKCFVNESLRDSLLDLSAYCIMSVMALEKEVEPKKVK